MDRHRPTGRRVLGFGWALLTASLWGMLPVVLKLLLNCLDAYTLTWYRFLAAGGLLVPVIAYRYELASPFRLRGAPLALALVCVAGLCGNYVTYLSGLDHISPGTAQVVIQLSPLFVLLGGLVIFKEAFSRVQWLGFWILIGGLLLFFNPRSGELLAGLAYSKGVLLIVLSALLWAAFILAQKQLLNFLPSPSVLFLVYLSGGLLIFPFTEPARVLALSGVQALLLVASVFLTLTSYLCFAEALKHLEASRIGAIITLTPLLTMGVMEVLTAAFPGLIEPERLKATSLAGAALVVAGAMCSSLGRKKVEKKRKQEKCPLKT